MTTILDRKNPEAAIPQLEKKIQILEDSLLDRIYPIGACFFTTLEEYNPAFLGGEWELENNASPYRWRRTR